MAYFEPSRRLARDYRRAMDEALWLSVDTVLDQIVRDGQMPSPDPAADRRRGELTGPLDYGAYFDLVLTPPALEELTRDIAEEATLLLAARHAEPAEVRMPAAGRGDAPPRVTNFSSDDYTPAELDRLDRWFDIEPDNAMGLTGVSAAELDHARGCFAEAMAQLRRAVPEIHGEVLETIGEVIIARPDGDQRFDYDAASSFALWGAFTINAASHPSWPRFYRTIVHEAGHNLLFAIARDTPLVTNDPDERRYSPLREAFRPVDGIYHAAFVSAREAMAFDRLLSRHENGDRITDAEAEAIDAMLQASVLSFWDCTGVLREDAQISPLGEAILAECEDYMRAHFAVEEA